ncbi:DUF1292 domain-containing protein [Gorillibacterium sp. sgz5001074]|uniref:DUF1292 domain-containing protein n=1 Tax=Gorillibacterium sp. sgz5001074 TaxID=3446695 RepID=UPI003F66B1E3
MAEHNHECGCGHDHDHEHEEEIFMIADEEGVEREMVMVYSFESDEKVYAVLLDRNNPESDGVIFRIEQEGEDAYLVNIETDEEWQKVVAAYEEIVQNEQ